MGPAILARAEIGAFAAKIHGSALEYTVKPQPALPALRARRGCDAASGVLVGSRHTAESLWAALPDVAGPAGEDAARPARRRHRGIPAARAAGREQPLVVFVGKLIVSKGVDLLLAAWPLVRAEHPEARLRGRRVRRVRGRGATGCSRRSTAATSTTPARSRGSAAASRAERAEPLPILSRLPRRPARRATSRRPAGMAGSVEFIGRLEHDEVAELLPRRRGAGDAEHLSRRPSGWSPSRPRPAGRCRSRPATRGCSRSPASSPRRCRRRSARLTSFPVEEGAVEAIAERLERLARAAGGASERGPRGACRDRPPALELGGGGPRGPRRLTGGARPSAGYA